jgi:hypothetical protein
MTRAPLSPDYDGVPDLPPDTRWLDALIVIAVAAVLIGGLFAWALA